MVQVSVAKHLVVPQKQLLSPLAHVGAQTPVVAVATQKVSALHFTQSVPHAQELPLTAQAGEQSPDAAVGSMQNYVALQEALFKPQMQPDPPFVHTVWHTFALH